MTSSEDILKELQEVSPALATISRKNVYSVPFHYFDTLAGNVMHSINDDLSGQLVTKTATPFSVPDDYFALLSQTILEKINAQSVASEVNKELAEIAPVLNTIDKQMPYKVPAGYFESLSLNNGAGKNAGGVQAKVIGFGFKKLYKYAAAAAVTGVVAVSTFLLYPDEQATSIQPAGPGAVNIAAAVNTVSDEDIISYLDQTSPVAEVTLLPAMLDEEIDINGNIERASDKDIKEYLNQFEAPKTRKAKES